MKEILARFSYLYAVNFAHFLHYFAMTFKGQFASIIFRKRPNILRNRESFYLQEFLKHVSGYYHLNAVFVL